MKSREFFMDNHDSWKLMIFHEQSWLMKNHGLLWTIMTHENSWFFMNNHDSWKLRLFYEQSWLMKNHEFLWTIMTHENSWIFMDHHDWLFRTTFLVENMTFHDLLATFWDHSGTIQASPRHHFKVISVTFRWLFGRICSDIKIDLGWSGHLVEVVSCR